MSESALLPKKNNEKASVMIEASFNTPVKSQKNEINSSKDLLQSTISKSH